MTRAANGHVCDILAFCTTQHSYRAKYFTIKNGVLARAMHVVLAYRERHCVLSAVRYLRSVVGLNDAYQNRHIVKFDMFRPLFDVFQRNGVRANLLNSAIIELIDHIHTVCRPSLHTCYLAAVALLPLS